MNNLPELQNQAERNLEVNRICMNAPRLPNIDFNT